MSILAIETSCDETGVAVVQESKSGGVEVLAQGLASQIDVHKLTGGVVPEVAAREHAAIIQPLIKKVVGESGLSPTDFSALAVTVGPGLLPALSVGVSAAQALAYAWQKPIIPVHHLEGHIYSVGEVAFPALALIVSGGHTMLVQVAGHLQHKILGSTRDDAAGEAFDKVARMLELGYPGGPAISKLAEQGNPESFNFTRPMLNSGDLDFSFSGLKTEVLYTLRDQPQADRADVAASFQQTVVDALVAKTTQALDIENYQSVLLAGGVAANETLRQQMQAMADQRNVELHVAPLELCGDNAVMIGQVALHALDKKRTASWADVDATARVSLEDFSS